MRTIIDAHVTALIAAVLLYIFGSGPVRGFGVTLGIGIATNLFTAVTFHQAGRGRGDLAQADAPRHAAGLKPSPCAPFG